MNRNTFSYKLKQVLMFAGPGTILFFCVVVVPFVYGLYLTFTSWDGVSPNKPFVGFENYVAAFQDSAYWIALGRTAIYWRNSHVVNGTNIAIILQYGHATRSGGFVEGIDYINPAIKPIFEQMANEVWKEVVQ